VGGKWKKRKMKGNNHMEEMNIPRESLSVKKERECERERQYLIFGSLEREE